MSIFRVQRLFHLIQLTFLKVNGIHTYLPGNNCCHFTDSLPHINPALNNTLTLFKCLHNYHITLKKHTNKKHYPVDKETKVYSDAATSGGNKNPVQGFLFPAKQCP